MFTNSFPCLLLYYCLFSLSPLNDLKQSCEISASLNFTAAILHSQHSVQYVVLGPQVKIIILNILPEWKLRKLKFSMYIAFVFLAVILKWQLPNWNIFLVIRKKGDRACGPLVRECGPWSANHAKRTKVPVNPNNFRRPNENFNNILVILSYPWYI